LADNHKTLVDLAHISMTAPAVHSDSNRTSRAFAKQAGHFPMTTQRNAIAVIDDDAGTRDAMHALLSAFGYRAELFASAEEFLSAAATSKATCLIVDIQLGGTSGLELARELAAAGFDFPTIFMTGSLDERFERQALVLGCVAFLHKPFPAERLIEAIDQATARRACGSSVS
jgi:FixJ family two-component response regulator